MDPSIILGSTGIAGAAVAIVTVLVQRSQAREKDSFDQYYKVIEGIDGTRTEIRNTRIPVVNGQVVPVAPLSGKVDFCIREQVETVTVLRVSEQIAKVRELGNYPGRWATTKAIFDMWRSTIDGNVLARPDMNSAAEAALMAAEGLRTDQHLFLIDTAVFVLTIAVGVGLQFGPHRGTMRPICLDLGVGLLLLIVTSLATRRRPRALKLVYALILVAGIAAIFAARLL